MARTFKLFTIFLVSGLVACTQVPTVTLERELASSVDEDLWFPEVFSFDGVLRRRGESLKETDVASFLKRTHPRASEDPRTVKRFTRYLSWLGILSGDLKREEAEDVEISRAAVVTRLLDSQLRFLECRDPENWECLEGVPAMLPRAKHRQDVSPALGEPRTAGEKFRVKLHFARGFLGGQDRTLRPALEKFLADRSITRASMAAYGWDDLDGSMKGAYDQFRHLRSRVRAVFDVESILSSPSPWVWSSLQPSDPIDARDWLLQENSSEERIQFQYRPTREFFKMLNSGLRGDQESRARLEWPVRGIMHQKYIVIERGRRPMKVWTGTANFSRRCLGEEVNANVALEIENDLIGSAFLTEFEEMFEPSMEVSGSSRQARSPRDQKFRVGRFHLNKTPNTPRYFRFKDGTEVRLHFSPTDDGEHRVLLPMIHSLKEGDLLRISMFGGAGLELVRAMQFAAARGAEIRIVMDRKLGEQTSSWLRSPLGNLLEQNPYGSKGRIRVRRSQWAGQNHHKTASLTRREGEVYRPEILVVGSQNWSASGNDLNDENLLTIRHRKRALLEAQSFNDYFDQDLWRTSRSEEGVE